MSETLLAGQIAYSLLKRMLCRCCGSVEPVAKRNLLVLISLHSYRMTSDHIRV